MAHPAAVQRLLKGVVYLMKVYVLSHFHSAEYWNFDSLSRKGSRKGWIQRMQWNDLVEQSVRHPGEGCFHFDGQEGIALYARFFRPHETRPNPMDDRGLGQYRAVFQLEGAECGWLLEQPRRLAAFQRWIEDVFIYQTLESLQQTQGSVPLPREEIDRLLEPAPPADPALLSSIQLAVLEYWLKQARGKKGEPLPLFYYHGQADLPWQADLPLLEALARLPFSLRRISFRAPLFLSGENTLALRQLRQLQGLNAVCSRAQRPLLRGIRLPAPQDYFSESARKIRDLLGWMNQSQAGRHNLADVDQTAGGPESLIQTLLAAAECKAILAGGLADPEARQKLLSTDPDNQWLPYFLSGQEAQTLDQLRQAARTSRARQEEQQAPGRRGHARPLFVSWAKLGPALAAVALLAAACWLQAQVIPEPQWTIQIHLSPSGLLSHLLVCGSAVLFFHGFKSPR